jgi:hypothetical protein
VSGVIVSIQTTRSGRNADVYLRGTCDDMTIPAVTAIVRDMLKNKAQHDLSSKKYGARPGRKPAKTLPVRRPDDEPAEPQELTA